MCEALGEMIPDTEENKPDQPSQAEGRRCQSGPALLELSESPRGLHRGALPAKPLPSGSLAKGHSPPQRRDGEERYTPRHQQGRSQAARRSPWHSLGTCFLLNKQEASEDSSRMSEVSHPLHRPQLTGGCQGPPGGKACSAISKLHTRQGPYRHWDDFLSYKGWGGIEAQMKVWL